MLNMGEAVSAVPLIPEAVEWFGNQPELNDEVSREVFGLNFAALFTPKVEKRVFVGTH
jgi:hypothetical protein